MHADFAAITTAYLLDCISNSFGRLQCFRTINIVPGDVERVTIFSGPSLAAARIRWRPAVLTAPAYVVGALACTRTLVADDAIGANKNIWL
jgi:hypothetical protein